MIQEVWPGDNIVVKSWPVGTDRKGDMQMYEMQCSKYAAGGEYPPNKFWSPCTMLPVVHNHDTYAMASGGSITEGTIIFTLQASKEHGNTHFGILAAAIGALFFLI